MSDAEIFQILDQYFEDGGKAFVLWYGSGEFPATGSSICGGLATMHGGTRAALSRFAEYAESTKRHEAKVSGTNSRTSEPENQQDAK